MRATRTVLAVLAVCFLAFAWFYVPRLCNCIWSDVEFTGWVSPIAQRLAAGERLYQDFTLVIPPGSFILVAALQRLLGRAALLDELWLCAVCQLGMLLSGYWLVRQFTKAKIALLATVASAPILIATPKEIAYDQTAQLVGWLSLGLLAAALLQPAARSRRRALVVAGFASALAVVFKSSTGLGVLGGAVLALGVVTFVSWRRQGWSDGVRALEPEWLALALGLLGGLVATATVVWAAGGQLGEFYQTVFVDGPSMKGGRSRALFNLMSFATHQAPVHITLLSGLLLAFILLRILTQKRALQVESTPPGRLPHERRQPDSTFTGAMCLVMVAAFGSAIVLLVTDAPRVPPSLRVIASFGHIPLMLGLLLLALQFLANVKGASRGLDRRSVFAAVAAAAALQSLMHNLSVPGLRLFYDNNPVIILSIAALLMVLERARARLLSQCAFAVLVTGLFGPKLDRYLQARFPIADHGFWHGLKVSRNGLAIHQAAARARHLAGPEGTVLVLPEDPMITALVGSRRPPLYAGVVFVDQFPERLFLRDREALLTNLPDVLVIHPGAPEQWQQWFRLWSESSPAERLIKEIIHTRLAQGYWLDSSYKTWFFAAPSKLDVYVKKTTAKPRQR